MKGLKFGAVVRAAIILATVLLAETAAAASDFETCTTASGDKAIAALLGVYASIGGSIS